MTELAVLTDVPTTLRLYWFGLYEDSIKWKWLFQVDLAPAIGYCAKRAVAECKHTYTSLAV